MKYSKLRLGKSSNCATIVSISEISFRNFFREHMVKKQHIILSLFLTLVGTLILNVATKPVFAASSTFVVNSVADMSDEYNYYGICETTNKGKYTFRVAVQQENTHIKPFDQNLINFYIAFTAVHKK